MIGTFNVRRDTEGGKPLHGGGGFNGIIAEFKVLPQFLPEYFDLVRKNFRGSVLIGRGRQMVRDFDLKLFPVLINRKQYIAANRVPNNSFVYCRI